MIDRATAARWVQRWDRQQEHYAAHREDRFAAMIDLVERATAVHPRPVVVDVGAGPGSLAARVATAVPHAQVVAVESDPFLVALGQAWCGDSVEFAAETAGSPGWLTRLGLTHVHAVVASSALHYPPLPCLRALYAEIHDWLTPDGILVNADHFPDLVAGEVAPGSGLGPWTSWWREAETSDELAPLFTLRSDSADAEGGDNGLTTVEHSALLRGAGFTHAGPAWQRGRSSIIVAG